MNYAFEIGFQQSPSLWTPDPDEWRIVASAPFQREVLFLSFDRLDQDDDAKAGSHGGSGRARVVSATCEGAAQVSWTLFRRGYSGK